jgi:hypothetical protein
MIKSYIILDFLALKVETEKILLAINKIGSLKVRL